MNVAASLSAHVAHDPGEAARVRLARRAGSGVVLSFGDVVPVATRVLVTGRLTPAALDACPQIERVVVPWAGLPPALVAVARERGLLVHNLHHNAASTAETAVALLLAAAKRVVPMDRALRAHDWSPRHADSPAVVLEDRTALVLGLGAIGMRVACALVGLGMNVHGIRRDADARRPALPGVPVHAPHALDALLVVANVLVVALPLTDATRGLLHAPRLARLPDGAVLVNVGRGEIVDEAALFAEVACGRIAAGLDVWWQYPTTKESRTSTPPSRFPFHELNNVVLSPHRGGSSDDVEERRMDALADLLRALASDAPPAAVDLAIGY
jgi:phosphoglycerate dehydrogenase-like enzyme